LGFFRIFHIFPIFSSVFPYLFTIFFRICHILSLFIFLPYFPNLFSIQLNFLPHLSYLFTIFFHIF
jgi:hypothetical protein